MCANAAYNSTKAADDPPFAATSKEVKERYMRQAAAVLAMVEKDFVIANRPREETSDA